MTLLAPGIAAWVLAWSVGATKPRAAPASSEPTHHCFREGAEIVKVDKEDCNKQGGKWVKIHYVAPGSPTPAPAADAGAAAPPPETPATADAKPAATKPAATKPTSTKSPARKSTPPPRRNRPKPAAATATPPSSAAK